jgi:hypothetical protein
MFILLLTNMVITIPFLKYNSKSQQKNSIYKPQKCYSGFLHILFTINIITYVHPFAHNKLFLLPNNKKSFGDFLCILSTIHVITYVYPFTE